MENKYLSLDERPEKGFVSTLMVIFGILCLATAIWWAYFLFSSPEQANMFWVATLFLFLFGVYQIYAGLGYARRYVKIKGADISVRQNSFLPALNLEAGNIMNITIRSADILFVYNNDKTFKLKLGIRYPDLGENIKSEIVNFAEMNKLEVLYKYDTSK